MFSGWDVYRSEFPLLTLINPEAVNDEIHSLLNIAMAKGTSLPRWGMTYWYFICRLDKEDEATPTRLKSLYLASHLLVAVVLLWLCTVSLVGNTSAPSIYGGF